jgi:hypothetical protein
MSEQEFPSGPWTGFYTYSATSGRHRTDLVLTFSGGRMTGEGCDRVGPFVIEGTYDAGSRECTWTKSYVAAHDVSYTGYREGKGIWGIWSICEVHGGFQIWPLNEESEAEVRELEEEEPRELNATPRMGRMSRW